MSIDTFISAAILHKVHVPPDQIGELAAVEAFKKEATFVAKHLGFDDENFGNGGGDALHLVSGEEEASLISCQRQHTQSGQPAQI